MDQSRLCAMKRSSELLVKGWKLLNSHCPICHSALMQYASTTHCPGCNLDLVLETDVKGKVSDSPPATSLRAHGTLGHQAIPTTDFFEVDDADLPASFEEMKKEYDKKNKQRDIASAKLGELMLQGWAMLGSHCPNPNCVGIPLMRAKGKIEMFCVSCENNYINGTNGDIVSAMEKDELVSTPKFPKSSPEKAVAQIASITENDESYDDFDFDDGPILPQFRSQPTDEDASAKIAKYILQGYALLDEVCMNPTCKQEIPLVQDRSGKKFCVNCKSDGIFPESSVKSNATAASRDGVYAGKPHSASSLVSHSSAIDLLEKKLSAALRAFEANEDAACAAGIHYAEYISKLAEAIYMLKRLG